MAGLEFDPALCEPDYRHSSDGGDILSKIDGAIADATGDRSHSAPTGSLYDSAKPESGQEDSIYPPFCSAECPFNNNRLVGPVATQSNGSASDFAGNYVDQYWTDEHGGRTKIVRTYVGTDDGFIGSDEVDHLRGVRDRDRASCTEPIQSLERNLATLGLTRHAVLRCRMLYDDHGDRAKATLKPGVVINPND